jgi:predicted negative regulator of RcsB-dependent stress response
MMILGYFVFSEYKKNQKIKISDQYNSIITEYSDNDKEKIKNSLVDLIYKNDPTYSPLSLYFLIDNKLITERPKINKLFDNIIDNTSLEKEIRNLIIYKKALFNADKSQENELLEILKPIINSKSIWKSHALFLMAEYFYSKGEKQKSKEFSNQILTLEYANQDLMIESQKRLNRDLSE